MKSPETEKAKTRTVKKQSKKNICFIGDVREKNYNRSMRYEFEYFYIYREQLLLSESIEEMEELLDLAAQEKQQAAKRQSKEKRYSGNSSASFSFSR